ncbi:hypothetical protein ABE288_18520 [Bacillus salipaludis]|uniref:hypothetical protein n=1 Tax=Bacillus salipaludis TaxID=2547811 RepID=UPI003D1E5BF9
MSNPNISNITPRISLSVGQTVPLLLSSIALEELALAHLLNAEAEKIQFVLGTLTPSRTRFAQEVVSLSNLLTLDSSVQRTLRDVIKKEMLLEFKFENTLDLIAATAPAGTSFGPFVFNFEGPAVQSITVPPNASTATIQAIGAAGGTGTSANGLGASIQGDFPVTPGQTLNILVGQQGQSGPGAIVNTTNGGGGGGTFVWLGTGPVTALNLLVAAGGGGGASVSLTNPGQNASLSTSGTNGFMVGGTGGMGGDGGTADPLASAGGGAGINPPPPGNGGSSTGGGSGGQSIFAGGAGGSGAAGTHNGGFGGGGGGSLFDGGGGGGLAAAAAVLSMVVQIRSIHKVSALETVRLSLPSVKSCFQINEMEWSK